MENNIKTILSITEDDNALTCTCREPIKVSESLAQIFGNEGQRLLKIVLCALALHFATEENNPIGLDAFISELRNKIEVLKRRLEQLENQTKEEK